MTRAAELTAPGGVRKTLDIDLPDPGPPVRDPARRNRNAPIGPQHGAGSISVDVPPLTVLGHEGSGRGVSAGAGVTHVRPGVGAALNSMHLFAEDAVSVFGLGGIGLSVLQGVRLAGVLRTIGIDPNPAKEELAQRSYATDFTRADDVVVDSVLSLTDSRGADFAFQCAERPEAARSAWHPCAAAAPPRGRRLRDGRRDRRAPRRRANAVGSQPQRLLLRLRRRATQRARFAAGIARGNLNVECLVTHRISLEQLPEASARMKAGDGDRTIIVFEDGR